MPESDFDVELLCSWCSGNNLHLQEIILAFRPSGEDGHSQETRVQVDGSVQRSRSCRHNPSERRHAATLAFRCEDPNCGHTLVDFVQHKGTTYVRGMKTCDLRTPS